MSSLGEKFPYWQLKEGAVADEIVDEFCIFPYLEHDECKNYSVELPKIVAYVARLIKGDRQRVACVKHERWY